MDACNNCGACENHVKCACCGACRNCGKYMEAVFVPYPVYPTYPQYPSWTYTSGGQSADGGTTTVAFNTN